MRRTRGSGTNIMFGNADRNTPVDNSAENDRKNERPDDEPITYARSCESFVPEPRFVNSGLQVSGASRVYGTEQFHDSLRI